MKNFLKGIIFVALACATASLGFAQGSTNNPGGCPDGTTTCANSGANAYAIVNSGGNGKSMMPAPLAGVASSPGVWSGYVPPMSGRCDVIKLPRDLATFDMSVVRSIAEHSKLRKHVHGIPLHRIEENDDAVSMVPWNPLVEDPSGDGEVLGVYPVQGDYQRNDLEPLLVGIYLAKQGTFTRQVAALWCPAEKLVASGSSVGIAIDAGHASGNNPGSGTLGWSKGSTTTQLEQYGNITVVAVKTSMPQPKQEVRQQTPEPPAPPVVTQQPAQPQPAAQPVPQSQTAPNIIIEKLEVVMPPQLRSGNASGHRRATTTKVVNNTTYNINNAVQPTCSTFGGFFSGWVWPWHVWSWLWPLLGLILFAALLLLGVYWIVRHVFRYHTADATFGLVNARVGVAEARIIDDAHDNASLLINVDRLTTAAINGNTEKLLADWEKRMAAAQKAARKAVSKK